MSESGSDVDIFMGMSDGEIVQNLYDDPLFFLECVARIVPKEGGAPVPFVLNKEQMMLFRIIWKSWLADMPIRVMILKARQLGISTFIQGLLYWFTTTRSNTSGLIISHERESSEHILEMCHRFHIEDTRASRDLLPSKSRSSKNEIRFDNPDWRERQANPGLGSKIKVATADNKNAGHSTTIQFFHGSEVARWPRPELLAGALGALSKGGRTFGFMESTAHGAAGTFYDMWQRAESGKSSWVPFFLSWTQRDEYRSRFYGNQREEFGNSLSPYEEEIQKEYALTLEQLKWRRETIASPECHDPNRSPEDVFREQYPLAAHEAFISSGRQFFDLGRIAQFKKLAEVNKPQVGVLRWDQKKMKPYKPFPELRFVEDKGGQLHIWEHPVEGNDYVIGGDVGGGLQDGDASTLYVLERSTEKVVARYKSQISPEDFGEPAVALAWYYNEAYLAPESNGIGMTTAKHCSRWYGRLHYHRSIDKVGEQSDDARPGWLSTQSNRKLMYGTARREVRDGLEPIYCTDLLGEMKDFNVERKPDGTLDESRPKAKRGSHDDCVTAYTIAVWVNGVEFAGPIRRGKSVARKPRNWKEDAIMQDTENEESKKGGPYDPHTGERITHMKEKL